MLFSFFFFFFNDPATTEIYTLSLHDALPICFTACRSVKRSSSLLPPHSSAMPFALARNGPGGSSRSRSEEHTSELQSQSNLVCRLLLEKKKKNSMPDVCVVCVPYRICELPRL